jgi:SAM-dependent methyltransferase
VGVDRSPDMLALARAKIGAPPGKCALEFVQGDIRDLHLPAQFDVVLMMFTVLGYQRTAEDIAAALDAVRRHLNGGGFFIFDVWNGDAVLAQRPAPRSVTTTESGVDILRRSTTDLDAQRQLCHVHFALQRQETGGDARAWFETHTIRYFFPDELALLLKASGLDLLELRGFPDDGAVDSDTWNMIGVARADDRR